MQRNDDQIKRAWVSSEAEAERQIIEILVQQMQFSSKSDKQLLVLALQKNDKETMLFHDWQLHIFGTKKLLFCCTLIPVDVTYSLASTNQ